MAGNSQRRGRSAGAGKKTATSGTGGKNRRSLAGRGATPKVGSPPSTLMPRLVLQPSEAVRLKTRMAS